MNAIPARVAGVPRIVVVTPPRTLEQNPAVAAALVVVGLEDARLPRRRRAGRRRPRLRHARRVPAVAKIVGPGNAYVAAAKRAGARPRWRSTSEAGPSEVVILADDTADAGWVAADLLAQAEHGSGDETVVLVTPSRGAGRRGGARSWRAGVRVGGEPRRRTRARCARNGAVVLVRDLDEGVAAVNALAPEHAEVMTRGAAAVARRDRGGRGVRGALRAGGGGRLRHRARTTCCPRRRGAVRVAALRARLPAAPEPRAR